VLEGKPAFAVQPLEDAEGAIEPRPRGEANQRDNQIGLVVRTIRLRARQTLVNLGYVPVTVQGLSGKAERQQGLCFGIDDVLEIRVVIREGRGHIASQSGLGGGLSVILEERQDLLTYLKTRAVLVRREEQPRRFDSVKQRV